MALVYKEYALNEASIEAVSAERQEYLNDLNIERRSVQRIRLTVEELLLNVLNCPDKCENISVGMGRQFGRQLFRLRYAAQPFDPTKNKGGSWAEDLMRSLGYFPSWSYRGKLNTVSLVLEDRRKRGTLFLMLSISVYNFSARDLRRVDDLYRIDTLRQGESRKEIGGLGGRERWLSL